VGRAPRIFLALAPEHRPGAYSGLVSINDCHDILTE